MTILYWFCALSPPSISTDLIYSTAVPSQSAGTVHSVLNVSIVKSGVKLGRTNVSLNSFNWKVSPVGLAHLIVQLACPTEVEE